MPHQMSTLTHEMGEHDDEMEKEKGTKKKKRPRAEVVPKNQK